jgi:hypothetical protein
MNKKVTTVKIYNPMFDMTYTFPYDKDSFMVLFNNHLANLGFFMETAITGETVTISPSKCSFIEIKEIDFKG